VSPARMTVEGLTPRPGIREQYLPKAEVGDLIRSPPSARASSVSKVMPSALAACHCFFNANHKRATASSGVA
jgi:hypothetical protein